VTCASRGLQALLLKLGSELGAIETRATRSRQRGRSKKK